MSQFVRDASGALINIDDSDYKYVVHMRQQQKQIQESNEKLKAFERDLEDIKQLLLAVNNKG